MAASFSLVAAPSEDYDGRKSAFNRKAPGGRRRQPVRARAGAVGALPSPTEKERPFIFPGRDRIAFQLSDAGVALGLPPTSSAACWSGTGMSLGRGSLGDHIVCQAWGCF